jgi:DHA1 family multidrug resistance protein-like MFS transporter
MSELLRDAPVGQLIRWITKGKVLQYREEKHDFQCPRSYHQNTEMSISSDTAPGPASPSTDVEKDIHPLPDLTAAATAVDYERTAPEPTGIGNERTLSKAMTRPDMNKVSTRAELEQAYTNAILQQTIKQQPSRPIISDKISDGTILVDWYTTDDPENPQNWSNKKKGLVVTQIYLYTLAVYMGSAI